LRLSFLAVVPDSNKRLFVFIEIIGANNRNFKFGILANALMSELGFVLLGLQRLELNFSKLLVIADDFILHLDAALF
jgi:hypothetical protein